MSDRLPTERDFLEDHGCLDAQHAWQEFGRLSIDAAFAKFCENPVYYQEDFPFMGERAFAFYFAVLERYVRSAVRNQDEDAYEEFGRVCEAIRFHFAEPTDEAVVSERMRERDRVDGGQLRRGVIDLCDYMLDELPKLCVGSRPSSSVTEEDLVNRWSGLRQAAAGAV